MIGFQLSEIGQSDVPTLKNIMDDAAPDARYAKYYFAMLAAFVPELSVIARGGNGTVIGGLNGLYDAQFRTLLLTHIVCCLKNESQRQLLFRQMLDHVCANASDRGVQKISATFDLLEEPVLESTIEEVASRYGLETRVVFQNGALNRPVPQLPDFGRGYDFAAVAREDIQYRHAKVGDAHAVWSLVTEIHREAEENPEKSGLDVYALSNYERLFRDTPETCAVATYQGQVVGFATGFMMLHEGKKGLFLWQTGVHEDFQGKGIGTRVERLILDDIRPDHAMWTVEGSNIAANRTAEKKADYMGMVYKIPGAIGRDALGEHEEEQIYVTARCEDIGLLCRQITTKLSPS